MNLITNDNNKFLNRDIIKYIAMFTMLLNHIATIFLPLGTPAYELLCDIGYFTAPTMCYFLVEGYEYTHSKKKYALRLLLFAFISQIPFCLALTLKGNMLFTLFLCFLIILTIDKLESKVLKVIITIGIIRLSLICDWPLLAPIFTLLFIWAKKSDKKMKIAFSISALLLGFFKFLAGIGSLSLGINLLYSLGNILGVGLSGICIIFFYNGQRMENGRAFSKWFFYIFYPAHLLILGIIRIVTIM